MAKKKSKEKEVEEMSFIELIEAAQKDIKYLEEAKKHFNENYLFQVTVYIRTYIKCLWKKTEIDLTVPCPLVFTTEEEAESYVPYFLKDISVKLYKNAPLMVQDPKNPKRLKVNEKFVKVSIKPLTLVQAFSERGASE